MEGQWQRFFMFKQTLLFFSLLAVPVQSVAKWMKIEPHTWVSLLEMSHEKCLNAWQQP